MTERNIQETPKTLSWEDRDRLFLEAVMGIDPEDSKVTSTPEADEWREAIGEQVRDMMARGIMPDPPKD